ILSLPRQASSPDDQQDRRDERGHHGRARAAGTTFAIVELRGPDQLLCAVHTGNSGNTPRHWSRLTILRMKFGPIRKSMASVNFELLLSHFRTEMPTTAA